MQRQVRERVCAPTRRFALVEGPFGSAGLAGRKLVLWRPGQRQSQSTIVGKQQQHPVGKGLAKLTRCGPQDFVKVRGSGKLLRIIEQRAGLLRALLHSPRLIADAARKRPGENSHCEKDQ